MSGMLKMLQRVAQVYDKASFSTRLKIGFVHAHNKQLTMSDLGLYVINKEQRVKVFVCFLNIDITMYPFVFFLKTLAVACKEALSVPKELKHDHKTTIQKCATHYSECYQSNCSLFK
ncbi:hypothetical protein BD560DRAFT_479236 [Blakeslea trispora]|nr:hypothetical protein BD560DRAFT_479236 [Blakeslea trispora]